MSSQTERSLGWVDLEHAGQITRLRAGVVYTVEMDNCGKADAMQATEDLCQRLERMGLRPAPVFVVLPKGCDVQEMAQHTVAALRISAGLDRA